MRFNTAVVAFILAVTASGTAIPAPDAAITPEFEAPKVPAEADVSADMPDFHPLPPFYPPYPLPADLKRDAMPEAGWTWNPWRPIGLPGGKRDADAKAGWTWNPWRPIGLPGGKRDAESEAGWTWNPWRPTGLPGGKRDAVPEAGWTWNPWRPIGLPGGKREIAFEA